VAPHGRRFGFCFDSIMRAGSNWCAEAVKGSDADVASVALSLLGGSDHPDAVEVLLDALKRRQHPGTRIAVQLRPLAAASWPSSPIVADGCGSGCPSLVGDASLAATPTWTGSKRDLAQAAQDVDPRVRKAAIQSLGAIGETLAAETARRLLRRSCPLCPSRRRACHLRART
jgi:HEAT repeat protein